MPFRLHTINHHHELLGHNIVWYDDEMFLGRVSKQNPTIPQPSVPAESPCDRCLSHSTAKVALSRTAPGRPFRDKPPTWVVSQGGSSTRVRAPSLTDLGMQDLVFIWCLVYLKQIQATRTLTKSPRSQVEFYYSADRHQSLVQISSMSIWSNFPAWLISLSFDKGNYHTCSVLLHGLLRCGPLN